MSGYKFLDKKGTFQLRNPELTNYLYFPIANESGVMSSVTPYLLGDSKMGQNTFLFEPVSSENLHNNKSSRNFWCNIRGKGLWSATGRSAAQQAEIFTKEKDETILEAGIMWHKLIRKSKRLGIASEITSFVPYSGELLEIMMVTIKNIGQTDLEITPTAAIPLYGRSADNIRDHRHVTSLLHRIITTNTGVVLDPTLTFDERGHQKNNCVYGVFGVAEEGEEPRGFYPTVEEFIGEGGSFENPKALIDSSSELKKAGYRVDGYEAIGGIEFQEIKLEKEEEKTFILCFGYDEDQKKLEQAVKQFFSKEACIKSLEETKKYWIDKINVSYSSGCKDFDTWMYWVNFQPMLRRIYGCSFLPHHDYGKGGRGWRDLWQDCLALLIMNPDGVRDMLIDNFGGVRMDGTNATIIGGKQGEFIADRNNITRVWMDHGVWPFLTTNLYIMQSGDIDILLKETSYFKDPQGVRGEEKDSLWDISYGKQLKTELGEVYTGTILEHMLVQHLSAFYDVGEHNHIRLRGADWNDALDLAKERGESVAFTAIYGGNIENMAKLIIQLEEKGIKEIEVAKELLVLLSDDISLYEDVARKQELLKNYCYSCNHNISGEKVRITCKELADNLQSKGEWIKKHIRDTEWTASKSGYSWYNGYYDNHGRKVEGDHENGVRMMLTSQVFSIMSNIATKEQVKEIIKAVDEYLYDESVGGYKLNTNFNEIKMDLGRMFGFAYGQKENGAVFSHMAVMYANGLYQRGFVKEGYKVIYSLYSHCIDYEKSKIYPGIPEYIGENGRGLYHYLTGAASWLLLTVLTEMYGVRGEVGNLLLEPKLLLSQFDQDFKASVDCTFAGRKLHITYYNKNQKEYGDYKIGSIMLNKTQYPLDKKVGIILRENIENLTPDQIHEIYITLE